MNFTQLGDAVYELLKFLNYKDIVCFCLTDKSLIKWLYDEHFCCQYLQSNYNLSDKFYICGPKDYLYNWEFKDRMKIVYDVLLALSRNNLITSKYVFVQIMKNATIDQLQRFITKLPLLENRTFLDFENDAEEPDVVFELMRYQREKRYPVYDKYLEEIDAFDNQHPEFENNLAQLVKKYMITSTEYIANINTIVTIPYNYYSMCFIVDQRHKKQTRKIQKFYICEEKVIIGKYFSKYFTS